MDPGSKAPRLEILELENVATILYQVSLQQAIASARIQLCAVAIKPCLH